jgi:hypothetical protein
VNKPISYTLLVPACGSSQNPLNPNDFIYDPSFQHIGMNLAIKLIGENIGSAAQNKIIAVEKINHNLHSLNAFRDFNLLEIGKTNDVYETIRLSLESIESDWICVNPIQTIPEIRRFYQSTVIFSKDLCYGENWSSMFFDDSNNPTFVHKGDTEKFPAVISHAFTGRFLARREHILEAIRVLPQENRSDLLYLAKYIHLNYSATLAFEEWLDVGHLQTYSDTKTRFLTSRFFNTIRFDPESDALVKRSTDINKLKAEYNTITSMPNHIKRYFPNILSFSENESTAEIHMEYIPYCTLAELYLFGNISLYSWEKIISKIRRVFDQLYTSEIRAADNMSGYYEQKLLKRQQTLENLMANQKDVYSSLSSIYSHSFTVNNQSFPSLESTFASVAEKLATTKHTTSLYIGHGDLCFNNILADQYNAQIKLIDPKSHYDEAVKVFGVVPRHYDVAKLNHSFTGLYDSVNNNLFKVTKCSDSLRMSIYTPPKAEVIKDIFLNYWPEVEEKSNYYNLLTASLFLSMLPLHCECEEKMIAFASIGTLLYYEQSVHPLLR